MTKETVRFPDGLVDRIRGAVDDSDLFESRSEFHRVSSELLLDLLDPDHEPTNFSYRELRTEIEAELGVDLAGAPTADDGEQGTRTTTDGEERQPASADGGDPVPESGDPVPGNGDPASGSESGSEDALSGPRRPGE